MDAVAAHAADEWDDARPGRRRHDDPIDSMLAANMFGQPGATAGGQPGAPGGDVHHALALSLSRQGTRRGGGPPPRLPHLGHPGQRAGQPPHLSQPHPAHALPPAGSRPGMPGQQAMQGPGMAGQALPHMASLSHPPRAGPYGAAMHFSGRSPLPSLAAPSGAPKLPVPQSRGAPRALSFLMSAPPDSLTACERRKVRKALRAQRRAKPAGAPKTEAVLRPPSAADGVALSAMDKRTARIIRNREVALRARQAQKAKMIRLESENSTLKGKAADLERENGALKAQIDALKHSMGAEGAQGGSWANGDVSLDGVIAP